MTTTNQTQTVATQLLELRNQCWKAETLIELMAHIQELEGLGWAISENDPLTEFGLHIELTERGEKLCREDWTPMNLSKFYAELGIEQGTVASYQQCGTNIWEVRFTDEGEKILEKVYEAI